jgi:hypothetical protein
MRRRSPERSEPCLVALALGGFSREQPLSLVITLCGFARGLRGRFGRFLKRSTGRRLRG